MYKITMIPTEEKEPFMPLEMFIKRFVCTNSLVRLWTKTPEGHTLVQDHAMEWEVLRNSIFLNSLVVGVTDIRCDEYPEAINIVIV